MPVGLIAGFEFGSNIDCEILAAGGSIWGAGLTTLLALVLLFDLYLRRMDFNSSLL